MQQYLLTILILLPVIGALALAGYRFVRGERPDDYRWIALVVSLVVFALSLYLISGAGGNTADFRWQQDVSWIAAIGAHYHVGVDGISLWLVLLTTLLLPISILSSWTAVRKRELSYYIFLLLLESAMIGVFVSLDLLLFYLFFEASLVPMFFLIGIWGGERRIYAAVKFFIYTAVGSLLMLVGIIALYFLYGSFDYVTIVAAMKVAPQILSARAEMWLFLAFALAFCIKVPLFPFHTWLPDAHTEAPTAGSVILAGVLLKMGTYGLLRFNFGLFPNASRQFAWLMITLAVIGIIYGALVAMVQPDVKRLVAYSSVSHMGFVVLGLFSFTESGMQGALYQMLNHGVSTGALFLCVGMIYERRHTRMIKDFGGLARPMPWFSALFVFASLSSIGLPFLNGFVGEFLIMLGAWTSLVISHTWIVTGLAATGVIWAAVYMLWMLQRVVFGTTTSEANARLRDLNAREVLLLAPLLILMLFMGVYPRPFLARASQSIQAVRARVLPREAGGSYEVNNPPEQREGRPTAVENLVVPPNLKPAANVSKKEVGRNVMKFFAITLLLCAFVSGSAQRVGPRLPLIVASDPVIRLHGIDGQTYDVEQMRGNIVLVSFGATWCTPCSAELNALEELKREYKDKPIKFFWVSIERADDISDKDLQKYARTRRLSFPVLRDPTQTAFGQFTKRVRLPLIVFYDKEGRLDAPIHFGMAAPEVYKSRMRERLNKLL